MDAKPDEVEAPPTIDIMEVASHSGLGRHGEVDWHMG